MSKKVGIMGYSAGNLNSIIRAILTLEHDVELVNEAEDIKGCDRLILPGVGASKHVMKYLSDNGRSDAIKTFLDSERPILGICLGMQILLSTSEEFGLHKTLEVIPGKVKSLKSILKNSIVPNIGWHEVTKIEGNKKNIEIIGNKNYFYFAHSYYCELDSSYILSAYSFNGEKLAAVICNGGNLWGTQFHPELSASAGLSLISKFLELS